MGIINKYRENKPLREYNNFCKKYKFCEEYVNEITVKVKEKFAVKFTTNLTVPPDCVKEIPSIEEKSEEIELITQRWFHGYQLVSGGSSSYIYVFSANKKGIFKIVFSSYTLTVTSI